MRELEDIKDPRAVAAVVCFVYAMTKYAGAYASVLCARGALPQTVMARGETERAVEYAAKGPRISAADSPVSVWVIPTNKELMIARHTHALIFPQMEARAPQRKSSHDRS